MSEKQEEKKVGFFQRTKRNLKMSFNEFKKVHWPTKKELLTYTGVVLLSRSSNCLDDLGSRFGSWCSFWIDFVD